MKIAVLGTGMVGTTLGSKLVAMGHQVCMGARNAANEKAAAWSSLAGKGASHDTFAGAAAFGETALNCTAGHASLEALAMAGSANLNGKILIDVANPLDFSKGMPPTLTVCNTDSLGEQIQRALPDVKVVKTLNTVNHLLMVNPAQVPGNHNIFVSGNDAGAKVQVRRWLAEWFGWKPENVLDIGDIKSARGVEMFLPLWLRLISLTGSPMFNVEMVRGVTPRA